MLRGHTGVAMLVLVWSAVSAAPAAAQNPFDEQIEAIRGQDAFGATDKGIIRDWVKWEVEALSKGTANAAASRARFARVRTNPPSSAAFVAEFVGQTAQAAGDAFGDRQFPVPAAIVLGQVLYGFDHVATVNALLAGLTSSSSAVRFLCAKGLSKRRADFEANADRLKQVTQAVVAAALVEKEPTVLGWLYRALAISGRAVDTNVFDGLMKILDARLAVRRGGAIVVDGAEVEVFEYFRPAAAQLAPPQQAQLVLRLAVFLRMAADRYPADDVWFEEQVYIERTLESIEDILESITGTKGGLRTAIESGVRGDDDVRAAIAAAAMAWVGDDKIVGVLNSTPWKVPRGAP